jgi:Na+-translocating ferredoxin:NAD+ oxidoreductase subunit C
MVKIAENKFYTENKPIEQAPVPALVYIPLSQHIGKPCDIIEVKPGDSVLKGQLLATSQAQVFAPVHSPVSGSVTAIQSWPHPSLGSAKTIVIANDGQEKSISAKPPRSENDIAGLQPQALREIIRDCGIVGMGGASFPTFLKLNPPKPVDTLIINIAECEPYLTGDSQLAVEKTAEIVKGIGIVSRILGAKKIFIGIEDNKPHAIAALSKALGGSAWNLIVLKSQYPQGGEKQLIRKITGKEVPRGKLPFDIGINVQNVSTVYAIYEAVCLHKPLYERVVTVTGSCLENPKNLLARIGTPVKELIAACGPLRAPIHKMIIGGPMMGIAQYTADVPVIKSTTGVVLLAEKEAKRFEESPCIRCGNCVRECASGLMPALINQASLKNLWQEAKDYGCMDCIECGLCNYVCPANRRIVQSVKRAKQEAPR